MSKKKRYPPRMPVFAAGFKYPDLRAGTLRTWWGGRWREEVASKDLAGRYSRGRAYAIHGQMTAFSIAGNVVSAKVQGARADAYEVGLVFKRPEGAKREKLISAIRAKPAIVARLAARDMPMELESIFRETGCSLFPGGRTEDGSYDVTVSCSCPDYAAVCKHSFAVLLALGEEISAHPALALSLRGLSLDELCE